MNYLQRNFSNQSNASFSEATRSALFLFPCFFHIVYRSCCFENRTRSLWVFLTDFLFPGHIRKGCCLHHSAWPFMFGLTCRNSFQRYWVSHRCLCLKSLVVFCFAVMWLIFFKLYVSLISSKRCFSPLLPSVSSVSCLSSTHQPMLIP